MIPAPRAGETVSIEIRTNVWVAATIMFLRILTTGPTTNAYDMTFRLNGEVVQHTFTPREVRRDNGASNHPGTPQPQPPGSPFPAPPRRDAPLPPYGDRDHRHP